MDFGGGLGDLYLTVILYEYKMNLEKKFHLDLYLLNFIRLRLLGDDHILTIQSLIR